MRPRLYASTTAFARFRLAGGSQGGLIPPPNPVASYVVTRPEGEDVPYVVTQAGDRVQVRP